MYAEQYGSIEHPAVMMFILGTKADVNNLVKMGKSIAAHYNWIALHGDDYTNRTAEKAVTDAIKSGGERLSSSPVLLVPVHSLSPTLWQLSTVSMVDLLALLFNRHHVVLHLDVTRLLVWLLITPSILSEPVLLRLT